MADPKGREWFEKVQAGEGLQVALEIIDRFSRGTFPEAIKLSRLSSIASPEALIESPTNSLSGNFWL